MKMTANRIKAVALFISHATAEGTSLANIAQEVGIKTINLRTL